MDLNDLKKAWNKYSSAETQKQLDEKAISEMLGSHTKSLLERIDRNIKIGFGVLFVMIVLFILDDFVFSPVILKKIGSGIEIPGWILILDIFNNLIIVSTFVFFVVMYYKIKSGCSLTSDLKNALIKIIGILTLYQRLFYFALAALLLSLASGFIAGVFEGFSAGAKEYGLEFSTLGTGSLILMGAICLAILGIMVGGIFLFMRWGFRRLYGNYLKKLKSTLAELNEIE